MVHEKQAFRRNAALVIVVGLLILLLLSLTPFLSAVFGALILATLFRPVHKRLMKKNISRGVSAGIISVSSIILIAIPLLFISGLVISEVGNAAQHRTFFVEQLEQIQETFPELPLQDAVSQTIIRATTNIQNIILGTIQQITSFMLNIIVMFFLLYYLLSHEKEAKEMLKKYLPFNQENTNKIISKFKQVTNTTVLGSGLISLIQGIVLGFTFFFLGVKSPVLLGILGAIAGFLPVVGIIIVWGPVAIMQFAANNIWGGIIITLIGFFLSTIDYTLRPYIQEKTGSMHPLVSLLGVLGGIMYFGFLGIVIGPLLLSYVLLTIDMFVEEYVS